MSFSGGVLHFKGLNGIRAICAAAVVVSHSALHLGDISNFKSQIFPLAGFAVTSFFTLSGFLITYLLLCEKEEKEISVKDFYIRRILRIWPLYYSYMLIALAVSYFILGQRNFSSIGYYIFFFPNIPTAYDMVNMSVVVPIPLLGHYWSLGIEEQYYAFYPHFVKRIRNIWKMCVVLFLFVFLIKVLAKLYSQKTGNPFWYAWADNTRFDAMAIGGAGAWLLKYRYEITKMIFKNTFLQFLVAVVVFLIAIDRFQIYTMIAHIVVSFATVLIIYYAHNLEKPWINLERKPLDWLGKISFGIYVYHPILIVLVKSILVNTNFPEAIDVVLLFSMTILLTVLLAYLSYNTLEKYFLRRKVRYTVVKSTN